MILSFMMPLDRVVLPPFSGLRILHMPIIFGRRDTYPEFIQPYTNIILAAAKSFAHHSGQVVYLTIDEKVVKAGESHRRKGLHVDGWHKTEEASSGGSWGGGGGGGGFGGSRSHGHPGLGGTGLVTVSSHFGCRAWEGVFSDPVAEGCCEHLRKDCPDNKAIKLEANRLYWMSPHCIHESVVMQEDCRRQFVRISLPSSADWYEGCTENPLGIKPTGKIAPARRFLGV